MADVYIGVMRVVLRIPGARSLKDGRQVAHSLRDRVRHRFDVTFHEVEPSATPGRRTAVLTTAGNDARLIRSILDRVRGFLESSAGALVAEVDVDVFQWHPPDRGWEAIRGDLPGHESPEDAATEE
jgi:uncharacterized protein YlxP (DUF503 family)